MRLVEDTRLAPIEGVDNWVLVAEWCRHYNRHNKYPISMLQRFGVGLYQIHQADDWRAAAKPGPDLLNPAESYMAAFLHFQMTIELMGLFWEAHASSFDLRTYETRPLAAERALYLVSKLQQQCFYKTRMMKTQRGSRFNAELTTRLFIELQVRLVSAVPSYLRSAGLEHASRIMIGTL